MIIKYEYSKNEVVEIEVDEELGVVMLELDRQEYNLNQKESRRHKSLDGMDYEGALFADEINVQALVIQADDAEILRTAVSKLNPKQQQLIYALYLSEQPLSQAEYAKKLGISEASVQQNARRAKSKLKEIFEISKKV